MTEGPSSGIEYTGNRPEPDAEPAEDVAERDAEPAEAAAEPDAERSEPLPRPDMFWLVIAFGGLLLVIVSFTALHWYRGDSGSPVFQNNGGDSTLRNVHALENRLHDALNAAGAGKYVSFGISRAYFGWLAWLLLVATVAAALLALLPSRHQRIFRPIVVVVALASIGLSIWAIQLFSLSGPVAVQLGNGNPGWTDFIGHAGVGFWVALVGFLLLGVGSALAVPEPTPASAPDPAQPPETT